MPDTMSLENRIARLEHENRRLKVGGLLAVLIIAATFIMGQARPATTLEAQRFNVVTPDGRTVATLGTFPGGLPYLVLLDNDGLERIDLSVSSAGSIVKAQGPAPRPTDRERSTVYLAVFGDGTPRIDWVDVNGSVRAMMGLWSRGATSNDQAPYIHFFDAAGESGTVTWWAP